MEPQRNIFALVIDDNPDQYEILQAVLSLEGYSVLTADNAGDALNLYSRYRPFVVITDFSMPDVDGAELIELLRSDGARDIPIMIVSAYSPDYVQAQLHPGYDADAILPKPLDFDLLLRQVRKYHRHRHEQCYA